MIVGINGYKGSGKNTVGDFLQKVYNFEQVSFAAKLKESVAALLDIPVDQVDHYKDIDASVAFLGKPISFRVFLQRYGTEAHRNVFGQDFWVEQLFTDHQFTGRAIVITDVRFDNELNAVREIGGFNVRIVRPGFKPDGHASEVELPAHLIDHVIYNEGTIEDLHAQVGNMMDVLMDADNE